MQQAWQPIRHEAQPVWFHCSCEPTWTLTQHAFMMIISSEGLFVWCLNRCKFEPQLWPAVNARKLNIFAGWMEQMLRNDGAWSGWGRALKKLSPRAHCTLMRPCFLIGERFSLYVNVPKTGFNIFISECMRKLLPGLIPSLREEAGVFFLPFMRVEVRR